jgi:hypothetical protein
MTDSYRSLGLRWARAKYRAKSRLKRYPLVERAVTKVRRIGRLVLYRVRWKLTVMIGTLRGTYARGVDVDKTVWVSPESITYRTPRNLKARDCRGRVMGGDWDRLDERFEDHDAYLAFKQVCIEGKDWPQTAYYQRRIDILDRGGILWHSRDESELYRWCQGRESLYETIRREGYKSQPDLMASEGINDPVQAADEVTVSIGRHGDLLFSEGKHRLAIAKVVGVERIPVRIAARHAEWERFREELLEYAKANGGRVPQPITHPDLRDIPASDECEETFKLIKESMSARQGRLLDVGARWGYYCHRFEDEGFDCHAIEDSRVDLYFLEKLRRAENKGFTVIDEPLLESGEIRTTRFDVVLALNGVHRYLKTKESYERVIDLLRNLRAEEVFFESYLPDEVRVQCVYNDCRVEEFVELLLRNAGLDVAECLSVSKEGRRLYRLFRSTVGRLDRDFPWKAEAKRTQ